VRPDCRWPFFTKFSCFTIPNYHVLSFLFSCLSWDLSRKSVPCIFHSPPSPAQCTFAVPSAFFPGMRIPVFPLDFSVNRSHPARQPISRSHILSFLSPLSRAVRTCSRLFHGPVFFLVSPRSCLAESHHRPRSVLPQSSLPPSLTKSEYFFSDHSSL